MAKPRPNHELGHGLTDVAVGETQLAPATRLDYGRHAPARLPAATPAVAPAYPTFASVAEAVRSLQPDAPLHLVHVGQLRAAAQNFLQEFVGTPFYAVKCNPHPLVVQTLYEAGIRHFDVASMAEIELVASLAPGARMAFMHPVKSRGAIARAYRDFGVRDFSVDCFEELYKIIEVTQDVAGAVPDLGIHVRMTTPNPAAKQDLSAKFGASPQVATQLLRDAEKVAKRVGLAFHVGSQNTSPAIYTAALQLAGQVIAASGVTLDVLDVGGGFPVAYDDGPVPAVNDLLAVVNAGVAALNLPASCEVWAEPGRCLVGAGETLVTRIELRKDNALYLNDGFYGSLFDAGYFNQKFPATAQRVSSSRGDKLRGELVPYKLFGPTCDCIDVMPGPYLLPADLREGDYVLFANHGAYGRAMASQFNGFFSDDTAIIEERKRKR